MKKTAGILLVLAGLCGAFAYWVDLMNFTDLEKGFVTTGSVWVRYGAVGALLLVAWLASRLAARRPESLERKNIAMALFSWLCGAAQAAFGALEIALGLTGGDALQLALGALALFSAWWMLIQGIYWFGASPKAGPAGGVALGILGSVYFLLLTCMRFAKNASSFYRFAQTGQVFAALAALLFTTVLLRACLFPESGCGRRVYFSGMWAFYLCTCFELPQAVVRWMAGTTQLGDLALSAALGCFGLLGAAAALSALSGETED